jgi:acetyl esterase/lipase
MRSLALLLLTAAVAPAAEPTTTLTLWPGTPPGETKALPPEGYQKNKAGDPILRLENVSIPTIAVYKPVKEKDTGAAVLVAPGGGYSILAFDHEGLKVCEWLNGLGVTGVLLKYRVPKRAGQTPESLAALQDGQRAMSLTRANAAKWGLDANRVGMLGFSAGGNLTANVSLFEKRYYDPVDEADKLSCVPSFAVLVYAGGMVDAEMKLKPEYKVSKSSPPTFFAHATDDRVPTENATELYRALKAVKVPAELHLYASGGHGFGMNKVPHPCATWPERCAEWMGAMGVTKKPN